VLPGCAEQRQRSVPAEPVPRKSVHWPKVLPLRTVQILSPNRAPGGILQVVEKALCLGLEGATPTRRIRHLGHMNAGKHRAW
jgi:hypothetical protein